MKKLLCLIITIMCCFGVHAQNKAEEVKQRAKNKAENRLDNKIDNALDKGLDKLEGLFKRKKKKRKNTNTHSESSTKTEKSNNNESSENSAADLSSLFGGGTPANLQPTYEFGSDISFEVTSYKKDKEKKNDKIQFQYFFPKDNNKSFLGMKLLNKSLGESGVQDMMMIMDNGTMLTFIDQGAMKIVNSTTISDTDDVSTNEDISNADIPKYKKTGRTKVILGHTCDEYVTETSEYKVSSWIASKLKKQAKGMSKMFMTVNKNKKSKIDKAAFNIQEMGMILEMESLEQKKNERFVMKATELNLNKETRFQTSGYKQINIGNFLNKKKK